MFDESLLTAVLTSTQHDPVDTPLGSPRGERERVKVVAREGEIVVIGDASLERHCAIEVTASDTAAPVLSITDECLQAGGAAGVAVKLSALGSQPALATMIGDDEAGRCLSGILRQHGVRLHVHAGTQHRTSQTIRCRSRLNQLLRTELQEPAAEGAVLALMRDCRELISRGAVVVLFDAGCGCPRHCADIVALALARDARVLVTPKGPDITRYRKAWLLMLDQKDLHPVVGSWRDEADLAAAQARRRGHDPADPSQRPSFPASGGADGRCPRHGRHGAGHHRSPDLAWHGHRCGRALRKPGHRAGVDRQQVAPCQGRAHRRGLAAESAGRR